MTSADSLQFVVTTHFFRIRLLDAPARPPRVLTHSFPLYLPYLPQTILCSYWTLTLLGASSSSGALYMIPVRQARVLPPSFFRSRLTTDTLDLGYILPTAGRIRVFHPLERALTGRTSKNTHTLHETAYGCSCFLRIMSYHNNNSPEDPRRRRSCEGRGSGHSFEESLRKPRLKYPVQGFQTVPNSDFPKQCP